MPQAVKDLVYTFNYNDMDSVMAALDEQTACVILEPMTFDFPKDDFLNKLKAACAANGSLLDWFQTRWQEISKKKLDMGKSCIRFKKPEDDEILFKALRKELQALVISTVSIFHCIHNAQAI